eukprot:Opistho-2@75550
MPPGPHTRHVASVSASASEADPLLPSTHSGTAVGQSDAHSEHTHVHTHAEYASVPTVSTAAALRGRFGADYVEECDDWDAADHAPNYTPKSPSLIGCYCNLATATVGAGILSYPAAMSDAGIVPTCILTVAFGVINFLTLVLLTRLAAMYAGSLRVHTYEELVSVILGRRAYCAAVFVILFNTVGALTGFLVVVADLGQPLFEKWITLDDGHSFLSSRAFVVICFAVGIALPLSMMGDMHALAGSSFVAVASVLMVAGAIVFRSAQAMDNAADFLPSDARLFGSGVRVVLMIPIAVFALGCHLQVVPVFAG